MVLRGSVISLTTTQNLNFDHPSFEFHAGKVSKLNLTGHFKYYFLAMASDYSCSFVLKVFGYIHLSVKVKVFSFQNEPEWELL